MDSSVVQGQQIEICQNGSTDRSGSIDKSGSTIDRSSATLAFRPIRSHVHSQLPLKGKQGDVLQQETCLACNHSLGYICSKICTLLTPNITRCSRLFWHCLFDWSLLTLRVSALYWRLTNWSLSCAHDFAYWIVTLWTLRTIIIKVRSQKKTRPNWAR